MPCDSEQWPLADASVPQMKGLVCHSCWSNTTISGQALVGCVLSLDWLKGKSTGFTMVLPLHMGVSWKLSCKPIQCTRQQSANCRPINWYSCMCVCVYIYIYIYTHTLTHTSKIITLHYIHCITYTLHLHYMYMYIYIYIYIYIYTALHYVTIVSLHCMICIVYTLHSMHYIALHCITLHYITSQYMTLHYSITYLCVCVFI